MSSVKLSHSQPLVGIGLKVISVAIFVSMSSFIKSAGDIPAGQIVFFRSFFAIFPIVIFLAFTGELWTALHTSRPGSHVIRGLSGVLSMGLSFFALTRLPLPEAITLNYAQPLLIVVFSALFLGEVIRAYRWTAVCIGLFGVLVISWPKLTLFGSGAEIGNREMLGVLAALGGASVSAVTALLVRKLVHNERTSTIVLWFSLTASAAGLCSIPFGWSALTPWQATALVLAGICGGIGQLVMTEAYRYAEASTVAPFEYTSMILGITVGYFVFGDQPTANILIGGVIVIGAGIFIVWREQRLGLERRAAKKVTPPQ